MGNEGSKSAKNATKGGPSTTRRKLVTTAKKTSKKTTTTKKTSSFPEPVYETEAAASLVDDGNNKPAFHGLLAGRTRPLLQYEQPDDGAPGVTSAIHSEDDSVLSNSSMDILTISDVVMTLRYKILIVAEKEKEEDIRKLIENVFETINNVANGWRSDSEISKLNNAKPEKPSTISATLTRLLSIIDELHTLTDGRFDPTIGVIKQAYEEALRGSGRPPKPTEMGPYKYSLGWAKRLKRKGITVTKNNANTVIDLDGVSKGFTVDLISESLLAAGYTDFYVDWAGDIRAVGRHPSGRSWRTAVVNPPELQRLFDAWKEQKLNNMLTKDDVGYLVELEKEQGVAIATSGDYFQIKKYGFHHIMSTAGVAALKASPRTPGSISVLASTCAMADGLATAAMTFGTPAEASLFLRELMKKLPNQVFGFCVVGRGPKAHNPEQFTNQFVPLRKNPVTPVIENVQHSEVTVSKAEQSNILNALTRIPGRLVWSGGEVLAETLVSCSIDVDVVVTLFVPKNTVEEGTSAKFFFISADKKAPIQFTLNITDLYPLGDEALAVAMIEELQYGSSPGVSIIENGERKSMNFRSSVARGDLVARDVEEQAIELFSDLPYSVCIVTATASDGTTYGLTVTSLTFSNGLFCFNVMESSTFGTAFTGEGAEVKVYILGKGEGAIANDVRHTALIKEEKKKLMENASMAIFTGITSRVETVHDHAVVVVASKKLNYFDEKGTPLQWHRRNYI